MSIDATIFWPTNIGPQTLVDITSERDALRAERDRLAGEMAQGVKLRAASLIAQRDTYERAILTVIDATQRYLLSNGISKDDLINCVLAATDNARIAGALEESYGEDWPAQLRKAEEDEWRDIASAPKDGTMLEVRTKGNRVVVKGRKDIAEWVVHDKPTHWRPLPAKPEAK